MKTINLNTGEGIQFTLFPDNQPHINIQGIGKGADVKVICSITDSLTMMHLLQTANALDNLHAKKRTLVIPYLMAARYDRLMLPGDSFDLEVVARLINSCRFEKVWLLDVHSEVASRLIRNAGNIKNRKMVEQYKLQDAVLICPDAGAAKKTGEYFAWNTNLTEIVYCKKNRDLATGKISLELQDPGKCFNRNCVIIDDICDGGATFLAIASQIKPAHLTLIVTHGIFSKGFAALTDQFDEIITSDSFCRIYNGEKVKIISIDYDDL